MRLLKLAAGLQPDEARQLIFEIEDDAENIGEIRHTFSLGHNTFPVHSTS